VDRRLAGGKSLLRAAISPLTTYGAADLRRSKLHTLVELSPTRSPPPVDRFVAKRIQKPLRDEAVYDREPAGKAVGLAFRGD
jgi:hypothetical protein